MFQAPKLLRHIEEAFDTFLDDILIGIAHGHAGLVEHQSDDLRDREDVLARVGDPKEIEPGIFKTQMRDRDHAKSAHVTFVAPTLIEYKSPGAMLECGRKYRIRVQALASPRSAKRCGVAVAIYKGREEERCTLARLVHQRVFILQILRPWIAGKGAVMKDKFALWSPRSQALRTLYCCEGKHER